MFLVIGPIVLLLLTIGTFRIGYMVGYNQGHNDGVYDLDIKVCGALRQVLKEMRKEHSTVVQLAECGTVNAEVGGPSPPGGV